MLFRSVFTALLISMSIAAAVSGAAHADGTYAPTPITPPISAPDADAKGTIGLICVDNLGNTVTWYSDREPINDVEVVQHNNFEQCVNSVVNNWANNVSSFNTHAAGTTTDYNQFLGGYSTYINAVSASQRNRH